MSEPLRFEKGGFGAAADGTQQGSDPFAPADPDIRSRVVVKVTTPGYVPEGFDLRTRIDETMFTADAAPADVVAAADDPQVESVDQPRGLNPL